MLIDNSLLFSDGQSPTGTVGTVASTNTIDLRSTYGDAIPEGLWLVIACSVAPASSGAATIQFQLQSSADDVTFTTLWTGPQLAYTAVATGFVAQIEFPLGTQRYVRLNYIIGTAALTAGTFQAVLVNRPEVYHKV